MGSLLNYLPFLALGAAMLIGSGGLFYWRRAMAAERHWRQQMLAATRLQSRLESLEDLLESDTSTIFLWDAAGSVRVFAGGSDTQGRDGSEIFAHFCAELTNASRAELLAALASLQENGSGFAFPLFSADHRTLACRGKPAASGSALAVSDVSEAYSEIITLRDALKETLEDRDFLRHAINGLPYPAWRRDVHDRLNWVNQAYCRAVEAASIEDAVNRGEELINRRTLEKTRQSGGSHRVGVVIGGQRRILDLFEVTNEAGSVGMAVDVTEIQEAQNEVREQLEAQRASLNLLKTPVAIFSADKNLEFFNQGFADLWKLPADWLAGGPHHGEVLEAMRQSRRIPEQADFPAWKKKQLNCYTDLIDSQEEIWQLPSERTLRVVTQARPQGGLFVLYEDLTEMLSLERSLNALSRVQLETINSLQEGVAVFGIDGRMRLYNPALLRLWNIDEALVDERPHIEDLLPTYQKYVPELYGWNEIKAHITGAENDREMRYLRVQRNNNTIVDCTVAPLPDGGTLLTLVDVTSSAQIERALRERNDALETTDRLKSEFITHISYQFRTPLNSIIGFAEILEHEFFGPLNERQHEYSQGLMEASQHLLMLVNDVIDLATIESGQMALSRDEADVRGLLVSVQELSRLRARESDLSLVLDCPPDIGLIQVDVRRIKQVMFNLISNAIKFSAAGETIIIGANRRADSSGQQICQLWVADKGVGIDRHYQENMFKAFESRSPMGKEQGAGIGLSLVRSLIELHEGWVEVESESGKGTKVICNLPQMQASPMQDIPVSPPLAIQAGRGRP